MNKLKEAAQRMVDAFAPHADKCRPCTIEWQNLREALAQQEWVGLTGEEIWEACMESPVELDCSADELYVISRIIEAKLKEKNEAQTRRID